jgi:N-acetylglutamate synthase-like GNAT family acetyltransferase
MKNRLGTGSDPSPEHAEQDPAVTTPPVSISLAQRLERAEASANAAFVEARARLDATVGAVWINIAGAYAMFDGPHSPLTQTFGVGLFDPFGAEEFARVEDFFRSRGAPVYHEICALASSDTAQLLPDRGYTPIEHSTVLMRETLSAVSSASPRITVRKVSDSEIAMWAHTSGLGWSSEGKEISQFVEQLGTTMAHAHGVHCFVAEQDGKPIAAGALNMQTDVALLAGASTVPSARGQGAQRALLDCRLAFAHERGVHTAMIVTQTGSGSQRNSERAGFRAVYERTKWQG